MQNGYGRGNGNGKRWLLIGLLVLGGFWLANDSYRDGFNDALVQSGQTDALRYYHGGPHIPWGLLILAGIGYIAWRTVRGDFTIGDLTFLAGSFRRLRQLLEGLLVGFSQVAGQALYLEDLYSFFRIQPEIVSKPGAAPMPRPAFPS